MNHGKPCFLFISWIYATQNVENEVKKKKMHEKKTAMDIVGFLKRAFTDFLDKQLGMHKYVMR